MWRRTIIALVICVAGVPLAARADWSQMLQQLGRQVAEAGKGGKSPSTAEMASALKQALELGTQRAVKLLGRPGGFLNDKTVRIPLPKPLRTVEQGLRDVGQGKVADEFIASMNHAAEQATPKATAIFVKAIRAMTLDDARKIVEGSDDAATQYFRKHTATQLTAAMLPVVREATTKVGVTRSYKRFIGKAGFLAQWVDPKSLDLDRYVTQKALDGLFLKMADEEKRIRKDPAAQTTALLRKVFGHD